MTSTAMAVLLCSFKVALNSNSKHLSIATVESAADHESTKNGGVLALGWFKECCR